MNPNSPSSPNLRPASLDDLLEFVPGLGESEGIELGLVSFKEPVDSSYVGKEHWLAIAEVVETHYESFDGFVVLHGTDTMAYSASALSFLLNNLAKPVVFTGSQLPIRDRRGDGIMNLQAAVQIAGYKATGLPCVPEVCLCFMDRLLRGNRATKVSAECWQGFDSPNYPWLGTIGERIKIHKERVPELVDNHQLPFYIDRKLAGGICIIHVHPGLNPTQFESFLRTPDVEGVILLTYGAGNFPTSEEFLRPLHAAIAGTDGFVRPLTVLNITQCLEGTVEMRRYEAGAGLLEAGVAAGDNMTVEAALAKMQWALARFHGNDIRSQLQIDQRGEQSQCFFDLSFDPAPHDCEERAQRVIEPPSRTAHGRYSTNRLKSATLRILGMGLKVLDPGRPSALRVFINAHDTSEETSPHQSYCCGEFLPDQIAADGSFLATVTRTVRTVVGNGPTTVSVVGVNAELWCQSIHLAFDLDAE
jgi:L-asparaginase